MTPPPPKERHCKPTAELIVSVGKLAGEKGKTELGPKMLWKSHGDRGNTPPNPRDYKPVFITPAKAREAKLVDEVGAVVAKSSSFSTYHDGRIAYRFPIYGYQISTSPLTLVVGKVVQGKVNPAFREGDYRT